MQITVDTDRLVSSGLKWIRAHVPFWPTLITFIALYAWHWLWQATYIPEPHPTGLVIRIVMMGLLACVALVVALISWDSHNRRW